MSKSLAQKLLGVQKSIGAVSKSSTNPHFRSKYADLNEVLDVAKEALNSEGIFISQSPGANEFGKYLETSLIDADSGQQIQGRVFFSGAEENMQKIGAAITYARRFGLVSLLALESEDDDGEEAVGRGSKEKTRAVVSNEGAGSTVGAKQDKLAGVRSEPDKTVPERASREKTLEKIATTSRVVVDSKRASRDEVINMLKVFGVNSKEELTTEQAEKFLQQLKGILK